MGSDRSAWSAPSADPENILGKTYTVIRATQHITWRATHNTVCSDLCVMALSLVV